MMNFVVSGISWAKARRIFASVAVSTAEVESSRISTLGFFSRARAMHSRWLLAAGDVGAALLDVGVVAIGHFFDELIGAGQTAGPLALGQSGVLIAPAEVFQDRPGKEYVLLQDHGDFVSQRLQVILPYVHGRRRGLDRRSRHTGG